MLERLPELLGSGPSGTGKQYAPAARQTAESMEDGGASAVAGLSLDDGAADDAQPASTPVAQHRGDFSARATADADSDGAAMRVTQPDDVAAAPEPRALSDEAANGAALSWLIPQL